MQEAQLLLRVADCTYSFKLKYASEAFLMHAIHASVYEH